MNKSMSENIIKCENGAVYFKRFPEWSHIKIIERGYHTAR
jgi:hypothetical protein